MSDANTPDDAEDRRLDDLVAPEESLLKGLLPEPVPTDAIGSPPPPVPEHMRPYQKWDDEED